MRFSESKPVPRPGVYCRLVLLALGLILASASAWAELQAGRDSQGRLWISDQGLPAGSTAITSPAIGVAPPAAAMPAQTSPAWTPAPASTDFRTGSANAQVQKAGVSSQGKDKATCDGIDKRYEETRSNLARIEQDKASGKLLIPDSGLNSLRQNLATLERLRALCR